MDWLSTLEDTVVQQGSTEYNVSCLACVIHRSDNIGTVNTGNTDSMVPALFMAKCRTDSVNFYKQLANGPTKLRSWE